MELEIIAHAHNGFKDKFGIPRQSREQTPLETRIVFTPAFRDRNMLRGIEEYSHLWLIWQFSEANSWSATVRPPRLGGNQRMGVFATRSPFRPNHLGLTSVRLLRIEETPDGLVLVVSGADLLDGTPIFDIKPYLSFTDAHTDARNGFAEPTQDYRLNVEDLTGMASDALIEIIAQDPRPGYQHDPNKVYRIDYEDLTASFRVVDNHAIIENVCAKK